MNSKVITYNNEEFKVSTYLGITVIIDSDGYYQASNICKDNNKCLFLINEYEIKDDIEFNQLNRKYTKYVMDNYEMCDSLLAYDVYCNK